MEVHHPHHVTHKKRWTEYLLEFFMLFLAVFLGFIAENIREHAVERTREKEFIHSIISDMQSDIDQSGSVLIKLQEKISGLDSLMTVLASPGIYHNSNNAYRLWNKTLGFADFVYNDGTLQQLKNSGGLRLIRNRKVADSIMKYDRTVRNYYIQADLMNNAITDQHIYGQLFDFVAFDKNEDSPVPLTAQGKNILSAAYADRKIWKYGLSGLRRRLQEVHEEGQKVFAFIKDEYNIE
ncbi:MAG TPA: hypothetical protein VMY77_00620 [Chitinophagaceae bacterium]|nr:hypothetical protein [Chitinophagaceae bacterium]